MLQQVFLILVQVFTLFIMIGAGYLVGKRKKIKESGISGLVYLMTHVSLPCAIIKSLTVAGSPELLKSIGYAFFVIIVITTLMAAASLLLYRKHEKAQRTVLQIGCVYGNSAFIGIALVQAVLGDNAVIYATLIVIVETIHMLLYCELTMTNGKFLIWKALLTPGVIGFVIGLAGLLLNITFPTPIHSAIVTMSGMNTPLAMLIVGIQMSKADIKTVFNQKDLYSCALIKLVVQPIILAHVMLPLQLPIIAYRTIVICKGTTQSAVLSAYAQDYGQDARLGSQLIALTSIMQIVTLPLITALTQALIS